MEPVFVMKRQLSNETTLLGVLLTLITANGTGVFRHAVEQRHDDEYGR